LLDREEELRKTLAARIETPGSQEDVDSQLSVAAICSELAEVLLQSGRAKEAEESWRQAVAVLEPLEATCGRVDVLDFYGSALADLGDLMFDTGQTRQAEAYYRKALETRKSLAEREAGLESQRKLADALTNLADVLLDREVYREAETWYRKALAATLLVAEQDDSPKVQHELALVYNGLGDALDELGAGEDAAESWETALSLAGRLTRRAEAGEESWYLLCQCLYRMTYLHAELQDDSSVADLLGRWKVALGMLSREHRADFDEEFSRLTRALGKKSW